MWYRTAVIIILSNPVPVVARLYFAHPLLVIQIPLHGLADTGLEGFGRLPAEFMLDLAGIDGVAAVVSRAVCYVRNLFAVTCRAGFTGELIEDIAQGVDHFDIGFFVPTADIVCLPWLAM